ncbi:hypothetical protein AYJ08_15385 [Brevibacillus sp. SKDU10]|nr:hypothetical protein AYJ08_15385 [Brevibacillus sp. SKDU10]
MSWEQRIHMTPQRADGFSVEFYLQYGYGKIQELSWDYLEKYLVIKEEIRNNVCSFIFFL